MPKTPAKQAARSATQVNPDGALPAVLPTDAELRSAADRLRMGGELARLKILALVRDRPAHVGAIGEAIGKGQPATSHFLAGLRMAGLVACERDGQRNLYAATEAGRVLIDAAGAMVASGVGR